MNNGEMPVEHVLSMKFRRADNALKRAIELQVKDTGVYRSQHRMLMHLSRQPNCSQVELAEQLEVSPAAIAVSLKKLEKGGYIRRETDENDNRIHQVLITRKGKAVIEESFVMFRETERRMFEGFSEEEMNLLDCYLERIFRNLSGSGKAVESEKNEHGRKGAMENK